jgi:hypothetical protein
MKQGTVNYWEILNEKFIYLKTVIDYTILFFDEVSINGAIPNNIEQLNGLFYLIKFRINLMIGFLF